MSAQQNPPISLQWLATAGVDPRDVEWLASLDGSTELHASKHRERAQRIYIDALTVLVETPSPIADLIRSLN